MDEKRYKEIKSRDMEWHLRKKPLKGWKNYSVFQVNLNSGYSDDGEQRFLISQTHSWQMKCWYAFSLWEYTRGFIVHVQPWCPHLSWSLIQLLLENRGSVVPPASATGSANPAHVSVVYFEWGRPPWKPARVRLVQVKIESAFHLLPTLVTLSTLWSTRDPAEMLCPACNACHSSALSGFWALCPWSWLWEMEGGESQDNIGTQEKVDVFMSSLKVQPFCKGLTFFSKMWWEVSSVPASAAF